MTLSSCALPEAVTVATAGWSIPKSVAASFAGTGSALERYSRRFSGVEINSTFYRSHRPETYARWRDSVPETFRFAVKIPKLISHDKHLVDAKEDFATFLSETAALGPSRGPLLLQLPPRLGFDAASASEFFKAMRALYYGDFVIESRHSSWVGAGIDDVLQTYSIVRVGADPPRGGAAFEPTRFDGITYLRLHGSPRVYYSAYDSAQLMEIANIVKRRSGRCWVVFDNTASSAAAANALQLFDMLSGTCAGQKRPARGSFAP